jgi:UPF0148 protein
LEEKKEITPIKRMADLLMKGATLTDLACPNCGSPLFRLQDGTLWCEKDEKKVIIVKEDQQPTKPTTVSTSYNKLESILFAKIEDIEGKIEKTENVDELQKLTATLSGLLDSLDKVQKMNKP